MDKYLRGFETVSNRLGDQIITAGWIEWWFMFIVVIILLGVSVYLHNREYKDEDGRKVAMFFSVIMNIAAGVLFLCCLQLAITILATPMAYIAKQLVQG